MVDWDKDGDLDIIKIPGTGGKMELYEQLDGHFVKKDPSPFKDVFTFPSCAPAVVDWNGDGHLDMLVATFKGVKYRGRSIDGTPRWCTNLAYGPLVIHKPGEFLNGSKMAYGEVT